MKHSRTIFSFFLLVFTSLYAAQGPKILPPEEAFKVSSVQNSSGITVSIVLGEGIYLYDDKLKLDIVNLQQYIYY